VKFHNQPCAYGKRICYTVPSNTARYDYYGLKIKRVQINFKSDSRVSHSDLCQ